VDPNLETEKRDKAEPSRITFLMEKEDPNVMKSNTERLDPNNVNP
jgi:hypothetical protein